ncbi:Membrane-anchored lipid-binding protein SIP3 [Candida viswanathii]|uniref:Membrane-anchored lipid-binding protein SIP3 n=1 Tax=Candida viswanathii TaxID=5486 RepID=A0A367Y4D5_9ASCO|nr:Membrane-anchored lipid-binding protein SIP3 [Candida viswanathii]
MPTPVQDDNGPDANVLSSMVRHTKSDKGPRRVASPGKQLPETLLRHFKLISVNFKEAALDSPSFRATINHLDLQITTIEQWLMALSSTFKKIPKYVKEVQGFCNSFLEHLVPTFLQDGIIDQEYTVSALHTTLDGLKTIWGLSLQSLNVNTRSLDTINKFKSDHIPKYQELRRRFYECQTKYDKYLSIYVSTSKSKDPLVVMEDAKQLFLVRKEYIHVSLDLVIELKDLSKSLNALLIGLNTELWKNKLNVFSPRGPGDHIKEQWEKIQRIQAWNDTYSIAIERLSSDMIAARNQVEEGCNLQFQPSLNPNDFRATGINSRTLQEIDEPGIEKHGYLFMKTWSEKSAKPLWVKRWAFIKDGVFGLLVLSPSQTFVQETDKVGILLCNVRYAPNEDRRFCFEIRTSDFTAIFQAETLVELKSWLKVFENEKNRISGSGNVHDGLFHIASSRFPPIISEFASTVNTVIDKELTNTKVVNADGQIITSSSLSGHIEKFEVFFERYMYFQIPKIHPPFITDTTKSSIIAYCLTSATPIPNALTANIWGSVNWGLYYLHDTGDDMMSHQEGQDLEMIKFQEEHLGVDKVYPAFYPNELVNLDIQMKALFQTVVEPGEYLVLSFSCVWSPNSKQELSGRCFITNRHVYFYMQALGFVALFKGFIGQLVSVDYTQQRNYDLMKVYNVDGVIKMKLYQESASLIKKKLVYLINNITSERPKGLREILTAFATIEREDAVEKFDQKILKEINQLSRGLSNKALKREKFFIGSDTASIESTQGADLVKHKINFTSDYALVGERTYSLPPKALFHALLGDKSALLKSQFSFASTEYLVYKPWKTSANKTMYRDMNIPCIYDGRKCKINVRQEINNMEDNTYYTFTQAMSKFEFMVGSPYSLVYKLVIVGDTGRKSRVFFYSKVIFDRVSVWNPIVRKVCEQIDANKMGKLDSGINDAVKEIGNSGQIVKAVYLYGKLSHTNDPETIEPGSTLKFSLAFFLKLGLGKIIVKTYESLVRIVRTVYQLSLLLLKSLRMNLFLVLIIIILGLLNVFFIGKTTTSYWTVRRANKLAYEYVTKEPWMLQRSIYLQDIQDMLHDNVSIADDNACFSKFKEKSFIFNFDADTEWNDYFSSNSREVARLLKSSFQDIGIKRHELLVKLKILKEMEHEITLAEWQNWLLSEVRRCDYIRDNIAHQISNDDSYAEGLQSISEYCLECKKSLSALL